MACEEQINLSNFIKSVHEKLRDDAANIGSEAAWKKHCSNTKNLEEYANAMHTLATNHWEKRYINETHQLSRIDWVSKYCQEYFLFGGLQSQRMKEEQLCERFHVDGNMLTLENFTEESLIKLLDVGSCYNPFRTLFRFDVTAIDIAPATADVHKCDFLELKVIQESVPISTAENITHMQENNFHVIVFSLFLEYLPSPDQRIECCKKAYKLLQPEGILIIITPDSKHVGANAKYMKSWRVLLSRMGFSRIRYEKLLHVHCMVYRKSINKFTTERWAELHQSDGLFEHFFIPQDFKQKKEVSREHQRDLNYSYIDIENELPYYTSD